MNQLNTHCKSPLYRNKCKESVIYPLIALFISYRYKKTLNSQKTLNSEIFYINKDLSQIIVREEYVNKLRYLIDKNQKIAYLCRKDIATYFYNIENDNITIGYSMPFILEDYLSLNPDLKNLTNHELKEHYKENGKAERRLVNTHQIKIERIINGSIFSSHVLSSELSTPQDFEGKSSFLSGITLRPLSHLHQKSTDNANSIFFHIFYPDEIKNYLEVIKSSQSLGFSLYVSMPDWMPRSTINELEQFNPYLVYVKNIGRDVLGFKAMHDLRNYIECNRNGSILMIHTKKRIITERR